MKKIILYFPVICLFILFSQLSTAQVNNLTSGKLNAFAPFYGTTQSQQTRGATDALVYIDSEIQDGKIVPALVELGYTVVVATSWSDFNTKLSFPTYQLAVMFNQNSGMGADLAKVTSFINAGGSMVYADWTHSSSFATLFQATFTSIDNQTIMDLDPTISTGLPDPITLVNTGWGIFSTGLTANVGGQVLATFPNGNAAIVRGNSGRTIILGYLSDVPPADYRQQLFENLFISVVEPDVTADPTSVSATYTVLCNGAGTTLTANGAVGTVYWYSGSCGVTPTSPPTGNTLTVTPSATTTYYARNYNNGQYSAGCASISIIVNPRPTVADLVASGTGTIKWYSTATGGTALATSTQLIHNTHYYASQTVNGVESTARLDVYVTMSNP